jgi:hypothetical protein
MIPSASLTHRLTLKPATGQTGLGVACYGDPVTLMAAVEGARGRVTLPDGSTAVAEAKATIRPGVTVPLLSDVEWRGQHYRVAAVETLMERRGEAGLSLTLVGAR